MGAQLLYGVRLLAAYGAQQAHAAALRRASVVSGGRMASVRKWEWFFEAFRTMSTFVGKLFLLQGVLFPANFFGDAFLGQRFLEDVFRDGGRGIRFGRGVLDDQKPWIWLLMSRMKIQANKNNYFKIWLVT